MENRLISYFDNIKSITFSDKWLASADLRFTVGLPQSGKSTWVENWLAHLDQKSDIDYRNKVIVSGDDFRLAAHGQVYCHKTEGLIAGAMFVAIRALLLNKNHAVLFDETNSSEWSIHRIFEICPSAQYVMFHAPPQVCRLRAIKSDQRHLLPVINRVAANLEMLDVEKIRKDYI